jgi:cytoskeleton protein RodZ
MTEKASAIGRYLQNHRKAKNIPLEAVSRLTRISMSSLRHIEDEEWDSLPSPVFVRGFLRAFAEAIGADPEEVLRRYDLSRQIGIQHERSRNQYQSNTNFWVRLLLTAVSIAILIGATIYVAKWMEGDDSGEAQTLESNSTETGEVAVGAANPAPVTEVNMPESSVAISPAIEQPKELTLVVSAVEATRFRVIADTRKSEQFDLKPGDELTLKAESQFNLLIDNAAGVHLVFNGQAVVLTGRRGHPLTLKLP